MPLNRPEVRLYKQYLCLWTKLICLLQPLEVKPQDTLNSALDSFYSDIAAIEKPNTGELSQYTLPLEDNKITDTPSIDTNPDSTKKKKKKVSQVQKTWHYLKMAKMIFTQNRKNVLPFRGRTFYTVKLTLFDIVQQIIDI